jgi:HEPN domain-containing protein
MVKEIRRDKAKKYMIQAQEFLEAAVENMREHRYNVAGFTAIQAMINSNDALTIYYLEKRGSSDHRECVLLHKEVIKQINDGSQSDKLKEALELRSNAGYMGEAISKKKAERMVRLASIFIEWVKRYLK